MHAGTNVGTYRARRPWPPIDSNKNLLTPLCMSKGDCNEKNILVDDLPVVHDDQIVASLLFLVDPVVEKHLSGNRSMITNTQIDAYNRAAFEKL